MGHSFLGDVTQGYRVWECPHFAFTEPWLGAQCTVNGFVELEL